MKAAQSALLTAAATIVASAFGSSATAATLSPTEQAQLATSWFTGQFNNQAQVAQNPTVPFITMENCAVGTSSNASASNYVHLEQYIGRPDTLLRSSAYQFDATDKSVDIKVFSYLDRETALGTCNSATPALDLSNLVSTSCDVPLVYKQNQFIGSNAPEGCATSFPVPGSTVVSSIALSANEIDALDSFILPSGDAIGTPIEFRRVGVETPEPTTVIAFVLVGIAGLVTGTRELS